MWTDEELAANADSYDEGIQSEIDKRERCLEMKDDPEYIEPSFADKANFYLGGMQREDDYCLNPNPHYGLPLPMWTGWELSRTSNKYNRGLNFERKRRDTHGEYPLYVTDEVIKDKEYMRLREERHRKEYEDEKRELEAILGREATFTDMLNRRKHKFRIELEEAERLKRKVEIESMVDESEQTNQAKLKTEEEIERETTKSVNQEEE